MIKRKLLAAALMAAGIGGGDARAVYLDVDGVGQALIYPYYTVQMTGADSWNTYISVVNQRDKAKALRVRFREGRNGREVAGFNLFLAPNDVWTGAVVPVSSQDSSAAKVITADISCTNPAFSVPGLVFSSALFTGALSDGLGAGLDRTREGYFEMIEMATLTGVTAAAVTHNSAGTPANCGLVRTTGPLPAATLEPPTGGLSGTLTLINVNSGMDMGLNAVALAELTTAPFYRSYDDPYPDFNAAEVTPESHITANGVSYDLKWSRGVDAVSSVLMSPEVINEYVLDQATASGTDWVLNFPTRRFYADGQPPFAPIGPIGFGQGVDTQWFNREERSTSPGTCGGLEDFPCPHVPALFPAAILPIPDPAPGVTTSAVLGSSNLIYLDGMSPTFTSGWMRLSFSPAVFRLVSEPGSAAEDHLTGASTTGRFVVGGVPVAGFMVRTFKNGTLLCGVNNGLVKGACQANYGGVFPHRYRRLIEPVAGVP
jgi:hypothetical protein